MPPSRARIETVVIGAGHAGLSTSYHLTARGLEHVVLERGRVGEAWRSQRWDGFFLNTPNWAQRLPGFHYQGSDPDAFAPLPEVIAYLDDYAASFRAPIREGVEVTRVRREGEAFLVETSGGAIAADHVIVAAGAYQQPTPTPLLQALPREIQGLHSSDYRRPEQLPHGAVVVVGSGQSGCQIAEELLGAGRAVYLSVGRCPWLPRRYRGRDVIHWMVDLGLMDHGPDTLPTPDARLLCNHALSGTEGGHDCNPRTLAGRGAIITGRVEAVEGATFRIGSGLDETLAAGDAFSREIRVRIDTLITTSKLAAPDPEPEEPNAALPAPRELNFRAAGIGSVIWANGFRPDHSWIDGLEVDEQGFPVHLRGMTTLSGLYFVGLPWLHKRKSSLFLGVGEDAEHVVAHLERRIKSTR